MNKGKIFIIAGAVVAGVFALMILIYIGVMSWPWIKIGNELSKSPDPPKPAVTYGEFPFEIIYEINGEIKTVKDSLVIEYEGIDVNLAEGKHIKWKRYFKSAKDEFNYDYVLFDGVLEGNTVIIAFDLGSCEYYMGFGDLDKSYSKEKGHTGKIVINSPEHNGIISDEELYEKYKIRVLHKKISEPIENSFE